jgi:hypothetical protein
VISVVATTAEGLGGVFEPAHTALERTAQNEALAPDAVRQSEKLQWLYVRHEEAAFAAWAVDAAVTYDQRQICCHRRLQDDAVSLELGSHED